MRKLLISLFSLLILCPSAYTYAQSPNRDAVPIIITHQDQLMDVSADAIIYNNHIMVPFRPLFEAFGARVSWIPSEKAATATKGNLSVKIVQSSLAAQVNEAEYTQTQAPFLHNRSLYVSLRFAAKALGLSLKYMPNPVVVSLWPSDPASGVPASGDPSSGNQVLGNPDPDKPDIEKIIGSVLKHKQAVEEANAIQIIFFEYTDEQFWVEIRSYGDIERTISSADVQAIQDAIFQAAGKTFPLEVAVKECCTRDADITGTVKEVDVEKKRILIANADKQIASWVTLAEDGKWTLKDGDTSALPFDDSLIGKQASAWTYGIMQLTDPAQVMAVKIKIE